MKKITKVCRACGKRFMSYDYRVKGSRAGRVLGRKRVTCSSRCSKIYSRIRQRSFPIEQRKTGRKQIQCLLGHKHYVGSKSYEKCKGRLLKSTRRWKW